ncbi:glycosyl hydrolase [Microlunatus panaciterrae]|uniref:Alpha-L-rhamnosidase n=1 Tax=Microlunatus panaciterrae TaxID=400768 RepID=A0ABS2RIT4_9ACTN|nr:glycosyl hydrolase [Microlunatus panaciterrae]MBM7798887.1 hypothetical protein [Microlunatus panaciterrae]
MGQTRTIDHLRTGFQTPAADSRPMMRWWWFGPSVEREELDRELAALAAAGFGGVEVSFVYPLAPATCSFGSTELFELLRHAALRARELGLRFDLTLGSGWSFGGPHITPELAARHLHWERREITTAAVEVPVTSPWPGDQLVAAFVGQGSVQERPEQLVELEISDGVLQLPAGLGPRVVLLAWSRLTGQNVKRAAAGAEGPVLDHYSAAAAAEHIRQVAAPMLAAVSPDLVGSVFCDSLEAYEADWTPDALAEFQKRRGYDARPRLFQLVEDGDGSAQLRADFYRTLSELYEDNFVAVFAGWAAEQGVPFRIQSYGVPPATVSSYRHADLCEGEGWGWTELPQTRWASSAAHLYGREVVSSEVWTWVHSPSFRATPLDLKGEAHEHFLSGVNQLIGHGWPYSPADAPGLGWFFYAAGAIDDRNPWWPAMPALTTYLHRLSWLLRQGRPVTDVKIYVPASDVYDRIGPAVGGSLNLWQEAADHIGADLIRLVRASGYDFDLVDDDATRVLDPAEVPVVVLPFTTTVPAATGQWLADVAAAGGSVISVGGAGHPAATVGVDDLDRLGAELRRAMPADVVLDPPAADIGVVHRRVDDVDVYLLANTGPEVRSFTFTARTVRSTLEEWDAGTGELLRSGSDPAVELTLHPYQSSVLLGFDGPSPLAEAQQIGVQPSGSELARTRLDGDWLITFLDGGEAGQQQVALPHRWEDQPGRAAYSGLADYETTVLVDPADLAAGHRLLLDLGGCGPADAGSAAEAGIRGRSYRVQVSTPVGEVAQVFVNGVEAGVLWAPPYLLDLTGWLQPGTNDLRLVVANTAANALTTETAIHGLVDDSVARYGRRFRMQDLDRAGDGLASGLLAVPSLVVRSA